jgi:hypothetical protein
MTRTDWRDALAITGARLCPKDQPQRVASSETVCETEMLRLVLRTQPRSVSKTCRRYFAEETFTALPV